MRSGCFQPLVNLFFIESEPFVKSVACSEPSPCHGVMEHSWDPRVPPKNSMANSAAGGYPVPHLSSDPNRPWPHKVTLGSLEVMAFLMIPKPCFCSPRLPPLAEVFPKYQLKISTENTAWIHWHLCSFQSLSRWRCLAGQVCPLSRRYSCALRCPPQSPPARPWGPRVHSLHPSWQKAKTVGEVCGVPRGQNLCMFISLKCLRDAVSFCVLIVSPLS